MGFCLFEKKSGHFLAGRFLQIHGSLLKEWLFSSPLRDGLFHYVDELTLGISKTLEVFGAVLVLLHYYICITDLLYKEMI